MKGTLTGRCESCMERHAEGFCPPHEVRTTAIACLARVNSLFRVYINELEAEVERMQAIVAKFPKTADGVPVVLGMKVWTLGTLPHYVTVTTVELDGYIEVRIHGHTYRRATSTDCYSTREAALAAKEMGR